MANLVYSEFQDSQGLHRETLSPENKAQKRKVIPSDFWHMVNFSKCSGGATDRLDCYGFIVRQIGVHFVVLLLFNNKGV